MIRTRTLPRLASSTVRRARLERWLAAHVDVPLRLLVGPAGSGKTTLLLKYLPDGGVDAGYCGLPLGCSTSTLLEALAGALALARIPASYDELKDALHAEITMKAQLVVDDVDDAAPDAIALLRRLVEDAPENLSFIYTSRSRSAIDATPWVARGLAVLCDYRRLAFELGEAAMLAEICGVAGTHADLTRLLEETDGWAVVLSGALRAAAEDARPVAEAYEHWRTRYGQVFTEFIASDLERASEEDRALIRTLIAGVNVEDQDRLEALEAQGLFVIAEGDHYRPYHALAHVRGRARIAPTKAHSPLVVRMLGRFEAHIDGREINWVRRRDQQFMKYLLLKPGGTATRGELASVFWPDADRQLAAQSVRTACSNIRKALAAVVGNAAVDYYFKADRDVCLNLASVTADVRRFNAHLSDGDASYDRGDADGAAPHYRAAEELYAGRLLEGDTPEPWFTPQAQALEERYVIMLERLAQIAFDEGDMRAAAEYAFRVQKTRPDAAGLVKMLGAIAPQFQPASLDERRRRRAGA